MRFLSVCSGIEAASQAWHPLGWKAVAFSEIEPFPCAVLAHHYPDTPNWGDMTKFQEWPDVSIDLLCGGTPCQSFSVAGLRKGLADPRGNLMLTFGAIAAKYRPRWLVWENVAGVLSSNGGRDFGSFLGLLGELGYGFAYRVLDAQYVRVESHPRAVPQRRRRVFVVGYLGDWRRAAAVLFERESLSGHPAPSRKAGQRPAPTLSARTQGGGGLGTDFDCDGGLVHAAGPDAGGIQGGSGAVSVAVHAIQAGALRENPASGPDGVGVQTDIAYTLEARAEVQAVSIGRDVAGTLDASHGRLQGCIGQDANHGHSHLIVFDTKLHNTKSNQAGKVYEEYTGGLGNNSPPPALLTAMQVRRLTPLETERLMGLKDGYTAIPVKGKPAADGPRYKSHGNSWAVNCPRWIGDRIEAVEAILKEAP